ncbi:MAG: hypothetical protein ABR907_02360 [Terracidiphilus sp.]|jgi:hypothetical protein
MLEKGFNIAKAHVAAATDLLHRRVPLPYSYQIALENTVGRIMTDSKLIYKALQCLGEHGSHPVSEVNAEWEIAVEDHSVPRLAHTIELAGNSIEVHRIGPSRAVRMENGSWFAHTPPSLCGVGFAIVNGNEREQTDQLSTYLHAVRHLVGETSVQSISPLAGEVFV